MVRVFIYLSQLLGIFAVAMLVPAVIGLLTHDRATADGFMLAAALTAFLSGAIFFALRGRRGRLDRVAGFMLVLAIWVLPPIVGAIPLMRPAGVDYLTALFEAASGYTTTGASALPTLRGIGFAAVFWRAELQWLGGLMTLVTIVMLLAPTQIGGIPNRQLPLIGSVGERRAATPGNILPTVLAIAAAYSAATAICVVLLLATGIPPFDAVCLALSTVSTGGFMPMNGGLYLYRNAGAEFVIMVFMMIGATSILWHRMMAPGRWRLVKEHRESYWVVGVVVTVGIAYAIAITRSSDVPSFLYPLTALRQGLFTAASLVSTTGFHARLHGFATLPLLIVLFLAIIGGGAFSTAGGLKFFRIGGMLVQSRHELQRLIYPHSVRRTRFGSEPYDLDLMKAIWSNLLVVMIVITGASALLAITQPSYEGALLAAVSSFSNIGPLYSPEWPGATNWPAFADFDGFSKAVCVITMILGRVEVIAVLGAFNLAYWRN